MAKIIPFPKKEKEATYHEKLILWTIYVINEMVKCGKAKRCDYHVTEEGMKKIEDFSPNIEDVPEALNILKERGSVEIS